MARINFTITLTFNVFNIFVLLGKREKKNKNDRVRGVGGRQESANPKREYIIEILERVNNLQPAADRELTLSPGDTKSHR